MLTRLSISNYALIDKLSVEFHKNLNTITGETGAGKSIVLGALGLILGNRADMSVLKDNSKKCIVEGVFEVGNYKLNSFFEEYDLDYDTTTILRREITSTGKSRAFINDTPVTLKTLRKLGLQLIDIHSQHQNLELSNQKFQLELVDVIAKTGKVLESYQQNLTVYLNYKKLLEELKLKSEKAKADLDYFQFQYKQLNGAELKEREQINLEAELQKLSHAEEIKSALTETVNLLDDEQLSVIQKIKESQKLIESIESFISEAPELAGRLQSSFIELQDIVDEANLLAEKIEHNPAQIEAINNRLNIIYNLQQKHSVSTVLELINLRDSFDSKINTVVGYDEEIKSLKNNLEAQKEKLEQKAKQLTLLRKKSFSKIEKSVVSDLRLLGMEKSKLNIAHYNLPDFGSNGKDSISFLFSANSDATPAEISKIASGGEMSRLMLAIKNLLRNSKALPTVVFDEIDSGVSGEIGIKMGNIIKSFSVSTQIINITHLPQIAAKGDVHFHVYKYEKSGKTYTSLKQLSENERVEELAKMVGGESLTESTLKTAQELLNG
ncbi:MAG: DNA repair protein RecN [Draconibacterium sp.]|nr:DNA repair protein RecN [Draconibacterium sp.]